MARMLESEKVLGRSGRDVSADTPKEIVTPTAEEVRTLVHGPRRPVRWMRWLGAAVLILATAAIVTFATRNDEAEPVRYQTPTSASAAAEPLTMSDYLPSESTGAVYIYNPVAEVAEPMWTTEMYVPSESTGAVYIYNPVAEVAEPMWTTEMYLPSESTGAVYNYNPEIGQ